MKTYFLLILFSAFSSLAVAQQDSSAYEAQRIKVNSLLDERSIKFGQYDQSLIQRTGIFGLKSKKDMQRSINILREIVKTDNAIFRELKILLDFKDMEKSQATDQFTETKDRVLSFMTTINKLQGQNDKLKDELKKSVDQTTLFIYILLVFTLIVSGTAVYLYRTKKLTFN